MNIVRIDLFQENTSMEVEPGDRVTVGSWRGPRGYKYWEAAPGVWVHIVDANGELIAAGVPNYGEVVAPDRAARAIAVL